jgi:hypothetical protein
MAIGKMQADFGLDMVPPFVTPGIKDERKAGMVPE